MKNTLSLKPFRLKPLLCAVLALGAAALHAQSAADRAADEGIWHGYDGEGRYASRLLLSIAEAIPAEKYGWRPGPGVRSVSETIMHIAISNYYLLSVTGPRGVGTGMPAELEADNARRRLGPSQRWWRGCGGRWRRWRRRARS
jgi:hypothetical protein